MEGLAESHLEKKSLKHTDRAVPQRPSIKPQESRAVEPPGFPVRIQKTDLMGEPLRN